MVFASVEMKDVILFDGGENCIFLLRKLEPRKPRPRNFTGKEIAFFDGNLY